MGIVIKVRNEKNYVEYVSDNINDNLIFYKIILSVKSVKL